MTVNNVSSQYDRKRGIATLPLWQAGLLAGVLAVVANLVVFGLGKLLGVPFLIPPRPGVTELAPLTVDMIVITSLVPAIVATVLFAVLRRFLTRPVRVLVAVAVVFLLVSMVPPLSLPVDAATKVALAVMHVVAAAAIVGVLVRAGIREQAEREGVS